MIKRKKQYVSVVTEFTADGKVLPKEIIWDDKTRFEIDRILDVRPCASTKVGGVGIRYTCRILNKETYLFLEEMRWFVEAKEYNL